MRSLGSGGAGHRAGTHARRKRRECRRWLGRVHPVNGNQGVYRATEQRAASGLLTARKSRTKSWRGRASGAGWRRAQHARPVGDRKTSSSRQRPILGAPTTAKEGNGNGHDERVLAKGLRLGFDFMDLKETSRPESTTFGATGYQVFCSGQEKTEAFYDRGSP